MAKHLSVEGDLLEWLDEGDILFRLTEAEAKIILGYLEGSGHSLEAKGTVLYLCDNVNNKKSQITIDEAVDMVCESNYELIEETVEKIARADLSDDILEDEEYLAGLIEDEKSLDVIFGRTRYQKEIKHKVLLGADGGKPISQVVRRRLL